MHIWHNMHSCAVHFEAGPYELALISLPASVGVHRRLRRSLQTQHGTREGLCVAVHRLHKHRLREQLLSSSS